MEQKQLTPFEIEWSKKKYSPDFDMFVTKYKKKFIRKDQLKKFVEMGDLTAWEYEEITGELLK